jgi:hypothetical protein
MPNVQQMDRPGGRCKGMAIPRLLVKCKKRVKRSLPLLRYAFLLGMPGIPRSAVSLVGRLARFWRDNGF